MPRGAPSIWWKSPISVHPCRNFLIEAYFHEPGPAPCRLLFSSTRELLDEIKSWRMREDFCYLISAVTLRIAPLRCRKSEILTIADELLTQYARQFDRPKPILGEEIIGFLLDHSWPDNLSELETAIKTFVAIGDQSISLAAFKAAAPGSKLNGHRSSLSLKDAARTATIQVERQLISEVSEFNGRQPEARGGPIGDQLQGASLQDQADRIAKPARIQRERSRSMKSAKLLFLIFIAPAVLCVAQDPTAQPAPPPVQAASAPATASDAPPAAPLPIAAGATASNYIIGASDMLMVTVWKDPTFSGSVLVRPDGMISIPLLGDIPAAGSTPIQLREAIAVKLRKYIQDPQVSVILTQVNSKKIYLLGEVGKRGPVDMTPGMTLLEAISSGGGLTDYAKTKKIYILRDENGSHQKIPVDYKDALKGNNALNVVLHPGDTIVVP